MKKILFISCVISAFALAGCKTTEANYRSAYEITKAKQTEAAGGDTPSPLLSGAQPRDITVDGIEVTSVTERVRQVPIDGAPAATVRRYNVVAGRFHQIFNAKAMRQRLADNGYPNAAVAENRDKLYYVIASSFAEMAPAAEALKALAADSRLSLKQPFPFILCNQ